MVIFAVVLFSQISRVRPRENFPLQFMSYYCNENISKITKLSPRDFPHLVQNRENICTRKLWHIQYFILKPIFQYISKFKIFTFCIIIFCLAHLSATLLTSCLRGDGYGFRRISLACSCDGSHADLVRGECLEIPDLARRSGAQLFTLTSSNL